VNPWRVIIELTSFGNSIFFFSLAQFMRGSR
jgi:hypothetical protein